ncbi:unnamed protein product, partial [Nesidiocoris tenuis]
MNMLPPHTPLETNELELSWFSSFPATNQGNVRYAGTWTNSGRQIRYTKENGGKSNLYAGRVTFSNSGLFNKNASLAVGKGELAAKSCMSLLYRLRGAPLSSWLKVLSASALSSSLYAAEIWGLSHVEDLERVQVRAIKSALSLASSTPDHYVRRELGLVHVKCQIFGAALNWYIKLCKMEDHRLPKVCLKRILELSSSDFDLRYSWSSQLELLFREIGESDLWLSQDIEVICKRRTQLIESMQNLCRAKDEERVANSAYNGIYKLVSDSPLISPYLESHLGIGFKRLIAQARMGGALRSKLSICRMCAKFDSAKVCPCCNWGEPDTLEHTFCRCPVYRGLRLAFYGNDLLGRDSLVALLYSSDTLSLKKMCFFLQDLRFFSLFYGFTPMIRGTEATNQVNQSSKIEK